MTCRNEVLHCAKAFVQNTGKNEFKIEDIFRCMKKRGTKYKDSTIKTHITSRMCANAPQNHATKYNDFFRISHGTYKINK